MNKGSINLKENYPFISRKPGPAQFIWAKVGQFIWAL